MMIRVMYKNGTFDIVKPATLDSLLEQQEILSFKRSDGWAVIGRDPVRKEARPDYAGPERRTAALLSKTADSRLRSISFP